MSVSIIQKLDKIHPYPAKYTVEMIKEFIEKYTSEGELVIDPFMGSGTTGLTATYLKRYFIGSDINPIANLVSNFKLNYLNEEEKKVAQNFREELEVFLNEKNIVKTLLNTENKYSNISVKIKSYKSIEHWFKPQVIKSLSGILSFIDYYLEEYSKVKNIALTSFSSIIVTVSNQESNTRYVAIEKENLNPIYVYNQFIKKFDTLLELCIKDDREKEFLEKSKAYLKNSKQFNELLEEEKKADFLITSPPYPNTYDYYLYHKHRMLWLGYEYEPVMNEEIGSRREFSSLKRPPQKFEEDLFEIFESCDKVLKKGAYILIIIGDGKIQGEFYDSLEATLKIGERLEWKAISADFTNLDETSKSFIQSFRTKGKKEHFILFQK